MFNILFIAFPFGHISIRKDFPSETFNFLFVIKI